MGLCENVNMTFPLGSQARACIQVLNAPIPPTTTEPSAAELVRHLERAPRTVVPNQWRFCSPHSTFDIFYLSQLGRGYGHLVGGGQGQY